MQVVDGATVNGIAPLRVSIFLQFTQQTVALAVLPPSRSIAGVFRQMAGTDRDAVKLIQISEAHIGTLIGKSRQAIAQGLLKDETYFRDHELNAIFLHLKTTDVAKAKLLEEHIRRTRPDSAAAILTANGIFLDREAMLEAPFVLAVIPDYRFFSTMHPDAYANLVRRIEAGAATGIVISEDTDKESVEHDLGVRAGDNRKLVKIFDETNSHAFAYTLFTGTEQTDKVQCWVLGTGGYQQVDPLRADAMFRFLFEGSAKQVIAAMKALAREAEKPIRRRK